MPKILKKIFKKKSWKRYFMEGTSVKQGMLGLAVQLIPMQHL